MYTNYNRDQDPLRNPEVSTKYTEYLKAFDDSILFEEQAGKGRRQRSNNLRLRGSHPLQSLSNNEVKFSNIFSPNESNAIKLQLLQKSSSLPLLDPDSNNNNSYNNSALIGDTNNIDVGGEETDTLGSRRRSTTNGAILHGNANSTSVRKGESVANILYSTIRHGHEYDNPSADETLHTGSDSKVDYDPHEPLPAVDQIALRHELLNNIRAISRATYFEDLYTGKVRQNSGSPEGEILRLLENPQELNPDKSGKARTIPSKETKLSRVDRWVKESSAASSEAPNTDTDEEKDTKQRTSLFHQSMWKEDKKSKKGETTKQTKAMKVKHKSKTNDGGVGGGTTTENSQPESDLETASAFLRNSRNHDTTTKTSLGKIDKKAPHRKIDYASGIIESSSQYLQSKYLGTAADGQLGLHDGKRRPFSFGYDDSTNDIPLSVSLPNVAHNNNNSFRSTPGVMHDTISIKSFSTSRPENLNYSSSTNNVPNSKPVYSKLKKRDPKINSLNDRGGEQVSHNMVPQKPAVRGGGIQNTKNNGGGVARQPKVDRRVPGIYARLNVNQWVMKKVWFYVNGDDLHPRFEYRFRQGKDIRDMDQLLDLLTKRFLTLPTGARFIFTTDGYLINSLEELVNENSYVVSSTRKFKALKYGTGDSDASTGGNEKRKKNKVRTNTKTYQRLHKRLSTSDGFINSKGNGHDLGLSHSNIQKSKFSMNSQSVSDVPKVVAHVIEEAAANLSTTSSTYRQPIRVINGISPSLQSQVLLNTRTPQPFEDLVRDLAMSVRKPTHPVGNVLQTLAGRQIRSYSQLRSELKAGQRTFYISFDYDYTTSTAGVRNNLLTSSPEKSNAIRTATGRIRSNKNEIKTPLSKSDSNSSAELPITPESYRRRRTKRSQQVENLVSVPGARIRTSRSPSPTTTPNFRKHQL